MTQTPQWDDFRALRVRFIYIIGIYSLIVSILGIGSAIAVEGFDTDGLLASFTFVIMALVAIGLAYRRQIVPAGMLLVASYVLSTLTIPIAFLLNGTFAIIGAALLTPPVIYWLTNGLMFAVGLLRIMQTAQSSDGFSFDSVTYLLVFIGISLTLRYLVNRFEKSAQRASQTASYLRETAAISQALSNVLNVNDLLIKAASEVQQRFDVNQVQIFLMDNNGKKAQLAASTVASSQRLFEQRYALEASAASHIGQVIKLRQPINLNQIGSTAPDILANTRSALALPIFDGERLMGVLDVQSRFINAFGSDLSQTLQIVANQIGAAIRNAQLFDAQEHSSRDSKRLMLDAQTNLREIQRLNQELTRAGWQEYLTTRQATRGISLSDQDISIQHEWTPDQIAATQARKPVVRSENGQQIVALPLMLGSEIIGAMEIEARHEMGDVELQELVSLIAQRLATNLDKARLFEESQEAAAREQRINEIVAQYQSINNVDDLLRVTVKELSEMLGAKQASIHLNPMIREEAQA